ncbi:hypothetical protein RvY_17036 [Ramazzottius varieornatus]|uniref:Oxysterol-binding protein n=1 Tax=Ramazzottius varieornatus TaxID=947166 RepID=A0A1D1W179_RAMVA|nr:hypothetical protein RvY_17036 [Ramazzottius varieornatus]
MDSSRDKEVEEGEESRSPFGGRTLLPVPQFSRADFSVWTLLKQFIGKDLTKMTVPVMFSEPLSFIQRLCEYMEYSYLLDQAALCDDEMERMLLVAAFVVSATASHVDRSGKPFNPLLGETFEFSQPQLNYRMVCEQVSHHPPISAYDAASDLWHFYGSMRPKIKCWGNSLEVVPHATATLQLKPFEETYTWTTLNAHINNILIGKMWIEQYGTVVITNRSNGLSVTLNYLQSNRTNKELHKVNGFLLDPNGKKVKALLGKWTESLWCCHIPTYQRLLKDSSICPHSLSQCQLLWQHNPRPPYASQYFGFTLLAMAMNELNEDLHKNLPPTDSRFRPDIRALENGNLEKAALQKDRLEDKQREMMKRLSRSKSDGAWEALWFKLDKDEMTGTEEWLFTEDYWKGDWSACPNIY